MSTSDPIRRPSAPAPPSSNLLDRYVHDAVNNTWVVKQQPPPLPPKLPHHLPVTKETQNVHELDASSGSSGGEERTRRRRPSVRGTEEEPAREETPTRKKRKLRILSLDGGGIRGYSTLLILEELMHKIYVSTHNGRAPRSPDDLPRPCEYFDLIGGNGTGGLIALMLGRLRMNIEACKEYYGELTRFVFITDKTLMGVPYRKTLFKASRLEEAIRHVVGEATRSPRDRKSSSIRPQPNRNPSISRTHPGPSYGNPYALLLDDHPRRCPTAVTAMYQGSLPNSPPVLLRTYPSKSESVPSYKTTIVQAGRATCAALAAFKPVTIGRNTFLDEGAGKYNPTIHVLNEARTEFSPCEIAVVVSIGTGKRLAYSGRRGSVCSSGSAGGEKKLWWEGMKGFDTFTEARQRLLSRVSDCENIHQELLTGPLLSELGIEKENYYRLNVEVGVGDFDMNEWSRLKNVSTNTRIYLQREDVSSSVSSAASKLISAASPPQPKPKPRSPPTQQQQQLQPSARTKSISNPSALGIAELAAEIDSLRESFTPPSALPTPLRHTQSAANLPPPQQMPNHRDYLPHNNQVRGGGNPAAPQVKNRASHSGMRERNPRPLRPEEWGPYGEEEESEDRLVPDIRITSPTTVMDGDVGGGGRDEWRGRWSP